jgi:hypothetical protein
MISEHDRAREKKNLLVCRESNSVSKDVPSVARLII